MQPSFIQNTAETPFETAQGKNQTVTIYCKNNGKYYDVPCGSSLLEIKNMIGIEMPYQIVAAHVNYKLEDLRFLIYRPKDIEFVDLSSPSGMRCYVRTLSMVVACAIGELFEGADLRIEHPICKGYYCTIQWPKGKEQRTTPEMIAKISERVKQIISENRPIRNQEKQTREVIKLFRERSDGEANLLETLGVPYCRYFSIGNFNDYYVGVLMPSTGYLNIFDLEPYFDGMLMRIPKRNNPVQLEENIVQDKMFNTFSEYVGWNRLLGISNVADFNKACLANKAYDMIKLSEALHEKKVAHIADMITTREERPKFVLISGPSSSGKTTFSKRLTIQLRVNGVTPVVISMDNYFVNRVDTPKDENGDWDFENINALDLPLFREHVKALLAGEEVEIPEYNFETGKRQWVGKRYQLKDDNIIILEGIHALNPALLPDIPRSAMFKIYVSALTTINLDNHNWIPTTDTRLLRRIVRDYRYRNYSARETIGRYGSVQRGEEKWIYPFQEEADVMFNSALLFELAVLKRHAEPILAEVPKMCEEYTEAHRLLKFLQYFVPISEKAIPPTSLLREFVGGSSFRY